MAKIERSAIIDRPVEDVWKYVSDWNNFSTIFGNPRPGEEIKLTSEGPFQLGSTFTIRGRAFGREFVTDNHVMQFGPDRKIICECTSGVNRGALVRITMEPIEDGKKTQFSHVAEVKLHGPLRLLRPILIPLSAPMLKRRFEEGVARMKSMLDVQPQSQEKTN